VKTRMIAKTNVDDKIYKKSTIIMFSLKIQ